MKQYSDSVKREVLEAYRNGESVPLLIQKYQVPRSTIYGWIQKEDKETKKKKDASVISAVELNNERRRAEKIERRLNVLQAAKCSPQSPLSEKLQEMARLHETGEHNVHALCDALNVDRGTFYNHINRGKGENTWYKQHREELKIAIFEIFHQHNQTFGSKRIAQELKARGFRTTKEMVMELMNEMDLRCIRSQSKQLYNKDRRAEKKANLLSQDFNPPAPNSAWAGDTTMITYKMRKYHICTVIDLYSRKVIACKISYSANTHLIKSTFELAVEQRKPAEGLVFHSDQGSAYTSITFEKYLSLIGVRHSFSKKGTPFDNAVQESFYKTLKAEELYRYHYRSEREFKQSIYEYIEYYNGLRKHSHLKNMSPCEFEVLFYKRQPGSCPPAF